MRRDMVIAVAIAPQTFIQTPAQSWMGGVRADETGLLSQA
jgi:hypothetical protein